MYDRNHLSKSSRPSEGFLRDGAGSGGYESTKTLETFFDLFWSSLSLDWLQVMNPLNTQNYLFLNMLKSLVFAQLT